MSSTGYLPALQALLEQAPAGANPFAWYAEKYALALNPGIAGWSKPLFVLVGIVSLLNIPGTIFPLVARRKQEGGFNLYNLRDHSSGSRYVCLNTTNVFLVCNLVTAICLSIYPFLHVYDYQQTGKAWMDLSWASMVWLAPFMAVLLTSIACIYGILVTPSPLAYARRASNGDLVPAKPPLSNLPCWVLNSFLVVAPLAVIATVVPPAVRLTMAVKTMELHAIGSWKIIAHMATQYSQGVTPAIADQAALLQSLALGQEYVNVSIARWRPCFGLWTGWCIFAVILSVPAFVAVYRVTKTRLRLAQQQGIEVTGDSGVAGIDSSYNGAARHRAAIALARSEHYNLSIQFASAAVLLVLAGVALLLDVIAGWQVHTKPTLLATALLVPMMAYELQASVALVLITLRVVHGQNTAWTGTASPSSSPRSARFAHSRTDSDFSMVETKKVLFQSGHKSGHVFVSALPKENFPVSPSVVHQITISQSVHVDEDTASIKDDKTSPYSSHSDLIKSDSSSNDFDRTLV